MRQKRDMTLVSKTQICAILSFAALEPRVFAWWNVIMLCKTLYVLYLWVYCSQHVESRQTELSPQKDLPLLPESQSWCSLTAVRVRSESLSTTRGSSSCVVTHTAFSMQAANECCKGRLHVTVSGKIAGVSLERTSNCTKILYFDGVSNQTIALIISGLLTFVRIFARILALGFCVAVHW